jgi:hypothetical protein
MRAALEIYLPASAPDNHNFGKVPDAPAVPGNAILAVRFEKEVWYNKAWRAKTLEQIRPSLAEINLLIGFSKSGLGALNIAIDNPGMFHSVIIFDAPLMHQELPSWNTAEFYSQETWAEDLPQNRLSGLKELSDRAAIIHISGDNFAEDHQALHELLTAHDIRASFLARPQLLHSWESGWVQEALSLTAK